MKIHTFNKLIEISKALMPNDRRLRTHHTSFIIKKNKILSIGINSKKTHPKNTNYKYLNRENKCISDIVGIHSEMSAIIKLGYEEYNDLTLINIRIGYNGSVLMSKPCNGCYQLVSNLGFKNIYYTNNDGEIVKL